MHKYPRVADVPYTYVTLSAGDCVYVPASKCCNFIVWNFETRKETLIKKLILLMILSINSGSFDK